MNRRARPNTSRSLRLLAFLLIASCGEDRTTDDADGSGRPLDATLDGEAFDAGPLDGPPALVYECGPFPEDTGWTVNTGFHAVTVADASDGLSEPVAVVVAGGAYGGSIYVVNQGNGTVTVVVPNTGEADEFVAATAWPVAPLLLTNITWDEEGVFDGALYVADQGSDGDGDSRVFKVLDDGAVEAFIGAPGPGLDDIYAMTFVSAGGGWNAGLYIGGDSDGDQDDWGWFNAAGTGTPFSQLGGVEGSTFDAAGAYGGGLIASRPASGGFSGDDTISRLAADGLSATPIASGIVGVHAGVIAPPSGAFGGLLHAASWQTGNLFSVTAVGNTSDLATGLTLTNYDANILAFSPDGRVLFVADRLANRLVCIEPMS